MTESCPRASIVEGRDAGRWPASLPFSAATRRRPRRALVALVALGATIALLMAAPAGAQNVRPWLDWKTLPTEHFVFHYPAEYREWTISLAQRMEGVRAQVAELVGSAPTRRVDVVVDDPMNDANGTAYPTLDAPTIVLWPTPPEPRTELGGFRVWQELLATHEYAHVAQLTRPSRNHWRSILQLLSPVPLGPITLKAPRWVLEGYATFVEGRVTGTGRPNNAWRAAVIRQFAIEGRMPSYAELSATGGWKTGSFAYLVGSAYLEWLARREGDSSITALWRRMTAVTDRSFDEAFAGVYGRSPAELYGRFSAEVTREALELERAMQREGLVEGRLVQHLARTTGDPAISPDGRFVALTIRHPDAPSQLVVWRTIDEPDTGATRRRERERRRDPDDVPDRRFFPPPKEPVIALTATDGAPYETPRWFADNRHLLVSRLTARPDGALRPDLYIWSAEDGDLRRVTTAASIRDADPSPDGAWAAAVRCAHGWCDLVRVDLASGDVRVLRSGSVARNYYRPRVSPRTGEIVVAEQSGDRWRIARVSPVTGELRYADPDDGVTRYDATWTRNGASIVTTSDALGIANLELIDTLRAVTRITSVTGAAVAADVAPDGAVWFLNLQGAGFDLRRLAPDSGRVTPGMPVALALADSFPPVLPPRVIRLPFDSSTRPALARVGEETDYGSGPARLRYLPTISHGFGGSTLQLALVRTDPVGRFEFAAVGAAGTASLPEGVALGITSRESRTVLSLQGWSSHEEPSRELPLAAQYGLDLSRFGAALRLSRRRVMEGGELAGGLSLLAELQRDPFTIDDARRAVIGTASIVRRQRDEDVRYQEALSTLAEAGQTSEGTYVRQRTSLFFGTGRGSEPLTTLRISYGSLGGGGMRDRESFVLGGIPSPLIAPELDARRVDAPAYPLGSGSGSSFISVRVAAPVSIAELFYSGVSTDLFATPRRSYGVESRGRIPALYPLGTPDVDVLAGFAQAVDAPVKAEWMFYVSLAVRM